MTTIIQDPEFVDLQKTKVRFKLIKEDGLVSVAELTVPTNRERGVNAYWDRIMDEFDVELMRRKRNALETSRIQQQEFMKKKQAAAVENEKLKTLFDAKMKAFELPYVSVATDDIKSAIRRAPDVSFLNLILTDLMKQHMTDNAMSYLDFLDYLDELEEQKETAEQEAASDTSEA
jgi:hypothetical protein